MTLCSGGVLSGRVCYKQGYPILFTRKPPNSQVLGQMVFPQVVHMGADLCSVLLVGPLVLGRGPELSPVKCSEFRELFRILVHVVTLGTFWGVLKNTWKLFNTTPSDPNLVNALTIVISVIWSSNYVLPTYMWPVAMSAVSMSTR